MTIQDYDRLNGSSDGITPSMDVWRRGFRAVCTDVQPGTITQASLVQQIKACYEVTVAHTLTNTTNVLKHIFDTLKNIPPASRGKRISPTYPTWLS